jgi:hypothetical protein
MKHAIHLEHRASSSQSKHEGEPSFGLCDRLDRTRVNSQRQLPTDHDYAVPTREYQTDQSSPKPAQAAARSVFGKKQKQRQRQKQPRRSSEVDTVTPYQAKPLIDDRLHPIGVITPRETPFTPAILSHRLNESTMPARTHKNAFNFGRARRSTVELKAFVSVRRRLTARLRRQAWPGKERSA